jgi:hypothetical protein
MAKKKVTTGESTNIKEQLLKLEKEKNDYLNNIKKQEDSIKGSYKADLKAQIKQKQDELKELEKEFSQHYGKVTVKKVKPVPKTGKKEKAIKKGNVKEKVIQVKNSYSDDDIKKVLEALDQGITDIETIRKTYLPSRRKPSIIKLIEACKKSESIDLEQIRSKL